MDWFAWLSQTNLDPPLVYDYAVTFADNELVESDVLYFNHEFLQSMGISVAKHRLEILKLARREKGGRVLLHRIQRFIFAIKKTRKYLFEKVEALTTNRNNSSLSLAPVRNNSLRWKVSMLQRSKRRLRPSAEEARPSWSTLGGQSVDVECWSGSMEENKWDSMFSNLKPT